ncbi:MAG: hypothetical protein F9K16_02035 [Thermoanaerobaculia bacterium]|jgi:hypothetical protein|nr:MAG: hypothetical protein F9K16_02035 [Thermoanaerobaculia bacterium]MBZ0101755.1 hypothetical protein [Thermoanaerobaculia bacterium]
MSGSDRKLASFAILFMVSVVSMIVVMGGRTAEISESSEVAPFESPAGIQRALRATPCRLAAVYWPAVRGCTVCDAMLIEKIGEWQRDPVLGEGLVVVTAIPTEFTGFAIGSARLPGELVRLARSEYAPAAAISPLPRLELWSGSGQLLLLRSIPSYMSQMAILDEEFLAARWFTSPLDEEGPGGSAPGGGE